MTKNNVTIGDKFRTGKHTEAVVVDFHEVRSMISGEIVKYICIAQATGIATNKFDVPFATVVRNKI